LAVRGAWLLIGLLPVEATAAVAEEPQHFNVLLLLADDMRADSIGALGNRVVHAPALDDLASRGLAFSNAYCLGGNQPAVCTPSRNMLLSGNTYFRWRDFVPPGMTEARKGLLAPGVPPNFPMSLRSAGYLTYHHGKRGNTAPLIEARFEINKYLDDDDIERKSGEPGKVIVDQAIAFLRANKDPRPWFMYLAFANPHDPRVAAQRYRDQYDPGRLSLPRNLLPVHPFDNGELTVRDEQLLPWPRTAVEIRRILHDYNATVTGLDHHIGRLIQTLREQGQLDQTIVIFSADQGIALGSHGLLGKQNLYDHSMKVPLIVTGPGIRCGRSDALVYLHDLFPTVVDLVGEEIPAGIDGRSFLAVLQGKTVTARSELMLAYRDSQRAVRDARWKLIRYPQVNVTQLFDLRSDPDELVNLADAPTQRGRVSDLLKRLSRLQKSLGDKLPLTIANPRPISPTTPDELQRLAHPQVKTLNSYTP
jgi:arylsulfatase A-like enzyme